MMTLCASILSSGKEEADNIDSYDTGMYTNEGRARGAMTMVTPKCRIASIYSKP